MAQPQVIPSKGKTFWLGFMRNWGGWAPPYTLDIIISSDQATSGTITMPRMGQSWPFTTVPGVTTSIQIPVDIGIHNGSELVDDRSILIEAQDSIAVFAVNYESFSADGTVVYPVEALGTDYRVMAYSGMAPGPGVASEFLIVANKDGTEVEITTTAITASGRMPGTPWVVQLDSGQTYQVQAFDPLADFTGSRVVATENSGPCRTFAVFGGSACAEVPTSCWACDHLFEQALPVNVWGSSYHLVPFLPSNSYLYRILAHEDGTQVTVDNAAPMTLAAGAFIDQVTATGPVSIQSDRPIAVAQYMKGLVCSGAGDPSMVMVSADHQKTDRITFSTVISTVVTQHYMNVVVDAADVALVTLDGVAVPSSSFQPFPTNPFLAYATLLLTEGSHTLICPGGALAYVYGTGPEESYAYSVGANTVVPQAPPDEVICGTGPDGTVTLAAPGNLTAPQWTTFNEPDDILHSGTTYTFTPTTTQAYVVTGTLAGSGCPVRYLFSVELDVPPSLEVSASEPVVCAYSPVQLNALAGPMGNYTYTWSPGASLNDPSIPSPIATPVTDTWYSVTVSTPSGCSSVTDSILVQASTGSVLGYMVTPEEASICGGGSVQLNAMAWEVDWSDDFDSGISDLWLNAQGWSLSPACGSLTGDALYFNGSPTRFIETVDLDLSTETIVLFSLVIGTGAAPCADANPGDDVVLEYSTNGGLAWSLAGTFAEWAYPELTPIQVVLPPAAQSAATRLRFRQLGTWGVGESNWALENVLVATLGTPATAFVWTPASGLSDPSSPDPIASPQVTTTYTISGTDPSAACQHIASALVEVVTPGAVIWEAPVHLCEDSYVVLDAGEHDSYAWSTGDSTRTIAVYEPGVYVVQVQVGECSAIDSAFVLLAERPEGLFSEVRVCAGDDVLVTIPIEGSGYLWSTGDTTRSIVVNTDGVLGFTVVDVYGCTHEGSVALVPDASEGDLIMPNVFSPNGDGLNDVFGPVDLDNVASYTLQVLNRWGQVVFEARNGQWDGRISGGTTVPDGTYFYIVTHTSQCGEVPGTATGHVTLVR